MRPGQVKPNEFELAILACLAGVGSFTNFACDDPSAGAPKERIGLDGMITMPGVPNGTGAVLFCKGGKPQCLEVFTYGDDRWEGIYDGFAMEQTA